MEEKLERLQKFLAEAGVASTGGAEEPLIAGKGEGHREGCNRNGAED